MTNEEKILSILGQMQGDISEIKTDVSSIKQRLDTVEADVAELKADVAALKTDVAGIKQRLDKVETDVAGIKIRLDVEFQGKLDLLAEGHGILVERMDRMERMAEETRDKVDVIHAVLVQHNTDINQLKRAK